MYLCYIYIIVYAETSLLTECISCAYICLNMLQGVGVRRSAEDSLKYLSPIAGMGPWVGWVRRALDAYLNKDYAAAALAYAYSAEIGGECPVNIYIYICLKR